ncbi:MAG: peroxidase [Sphingobium sp. SCN 64-10]|nr:MAG: peroxidase [Sphingobium sp. SCN 64-10]
MDNWLPTLIAATPEQGFDLALKLSRVAVKKAQPSEDVREKVRKDYEDDAESLIAISQVVAINFQTIAAANGYWR